MKANAPIVAVAILAAAISCTKDSPVRPSGDQFWTLTGTVRQASTAAGVSGATLDILDGPNAGRFTGTNDAGAFTFANLQPSSFTVRVRHADFLETAQGVTLTGDRVLDFSLTRRPRANLVGEGDTVFHPQPPAFTSWDFRARGFNRGDGCATDVTGTMRLRNSQGFDVPGSARTFTVPVALVRPSDRFDYVGCCYTTAELDAMVYTVTTFQWVDAPCS